MLQREQIDYLLVKAYNAAVRAGARILEVYRSGDFSTRLKSDNTPTTLADREAHNTIKTYLGQTRIPLMSEEGRDLLFEERGGWDLYWLVDPLDGTREFIRQESHQFSVNIALMVDNEPFFGVVYMPSFERMYFSDPERGAFVRERVVPDEQAEFTVAGIFAGARQLPLAEGPNEPLRVVVSRTSTSPETDRFVEGLRERYGTLEVVPTGSSYKFCLVAEGAADLYVRGTHSFEWDTAAAQAVASAAGARTVDLGGNAPLKYNKQDLTQPFFVCRSRFVPN
jgi:3'(2'), 5'-bisphosphate nucleotidase